MSKNIDRIEDIKLKDLLAVINTSQPIQLESIGCGEIFFPTYSDMINYSSDYYVTNIVSSKETLIISISKAI